MDTLVERTSAERSRLLLIDARTGRTLGRRSTESQATGHDGRTLAFEDDQHLLALFDNQMLCLDAATLEPRPLRYAVPPGRGLSHLTLSAHFLAYSRGADRQSVVLHRRPGGGPLLELQLPAPVDALAIGPREDRMGLGFEDGTIELRALPSGELLASTASTGARVNALAFHPQGELLCAGNFAGVLSIHDADELELRGSLSGHERYVYDLDFDPSGERLFSASGDRTLRLWSTDDVNERIAAREARRQRVSRVRPQVEAWWEELGEPEAVLERVDAHPNWDAQERAVGRDEVLRLGLAR